MLQEDARKFYSSEPYKSFQRGTRKGIGLPDVKPLVLFVRLSCCVWLGCLAVCLLVSVMLKHVLLPTVACTNSYNLDLVKHSSPR